MHVYRSGKLERVEVKHDEGYDAVAGDDRLIRQSLVTSGEAHNWCMSAPGLSHIAGSHDKSPASGERLVFDKVCPHFARQSLERCHILRLSVEDVSISRIAVHPVDRHTGVVWKRKGCGHPIELSRPEGYYTVTIDIH